MKLTLSPQPELQYARESLSDAMLSSVKTLGGFASRLSSVMPDIISGFSASKEIIELPEVIDVHAKGILKTVQDVSYANLRELTACIPEGVNVTYLEYLNVLLPFTLKARSIQVDVVKPYMLFLAQLISDKSALMSTKNNRSEYAEMEKARDDMYEEFSKLYKKNSFDAKVTVKDVIDRNSDWKEVLYKLNQCNTNLEAINRKDIKHQIQQCTDYLEVLYTYLQENKMDNASAESAQFLSEGAYCVARELEAMSMIYYRTLTLSAAINDTINHIVHTVG